MKPRRLLRYAVMGGVLLIVGGSPFAFGAVHPIFYTAFQTAAFCLVVLGAVADALGREPGGPREFKVLCWVAAAFGLLVAFQLLCLPVLLMRVLSPNTLEVLRAALPWRSGPSAASISLHPFGTQLSAMQYLACFGLFALVIGLFRTGRRRLALAWVLTALGAALAFVGLYGHWRAPEGIYGFWQSVYGGKPFGPFVNRNHFAGYLAMVLPIAAALTASRGRRSGRHHPGRHGRGDSVQAGQIAAASCFLVMFVALVASLSRGGVVSAAAAGCIMALVAWLRVRGRRSALALAALFLVGFLVGVSYAGPELADRLGQLWSALADPLETTRAIVALCTLEIVGLYPVFGVGLGTFSAVFPSVQTADLGPGFYRYAHNDFVQLLAETGVAGLVIGVAFLGALVRLSYRRLKRGEIETDWWLTLGAAASVGALTVHSLLDFNLHIPANAFLASAVVGLLCVSAVSDRAPRERPLVRRRPVAAAACLACVAVGMGAAGVVAVRHYLSTDLVRDREVSSRAVAALSRARSLSPLDARPPEMLSLVYTKLAREARGEAAVQHYRTAVGFGQLAVELNPTCSLYHYRQGWLRYWAAGRPTREDFRAAEAHLTQAVRFDPAHPEWALSLARFCLQTGRFAMADNLFARALKLDPGRLLEVIADLTEAATSVDRIRQVLPDTASAHVALGDYLRDRKEFAEAAKSYALACARAQAASPRDRAAAALRLARSGGAARAMAYLESWTSADGQQIEYLRALAEIARIEGDQGAMAEYLKMIVHKAPEDVNALMKLGDVRRAEGDWEEALGLYGGAFRLQPASEALCVRVTECLTRLDREAEAIETARAFLLRRPDSAAVHFGLGMILYAGDRVVEAVEHLQRAAELDPENERYRQELENASRVLHGLRQLRSGAESQAPAP